MSFWRAKQCFDDALRYLDPQEDPVMWDICVGLAELAEGLAELAAAVQNPSATPQLQQLATVLDDLQRRVRRIEGLL